MEKEEEEVLSCLLNDDDSDEVQSPKPKNMIACMMMGEPPEKKHRTHRYLEIGEVEKYFAVKFRRGREVGFLERLWCKQ